MIASRAVSGGRALLTFPVRLGQQLDQVATRRCRRVKSCPALLRTKSPRPGLQLCPPARKNHGADLRKVSLLCVSQLLSLVIARVCRGGHKTLSRREQTPQGTRQSCQSKVASRFWFVFFVQFVFPVGCSQCAELKIVFKRCNTECNFPQAAVK